MGSIKLENVKKSYGKDVILDDLNLEIEDGSFTILVGPSGCGKSTTLRLITGLESLTSGNIYIDGVNVNDITPGKRDIAMVFQNYALYPTMTVKENIEFGLTNKKMPKSEIEKRTNEICEIVGLLDYLDRKPSTLSGGQRQRVALARAMVKKPKVFLMDEPLSNLDAKLRGQMRVELIELHKRLGTTFVYVTHDQVEAMSMGDTIVLMDQGKIIQNSSPEILYKNPNSIFAAQFIGTPVTNIIDNAMSNEIKIGIRPEDLLFEKIPGAITIDAKILTKENLGSEKIYSAETKFGRLMIKSSSDINDDVQILLYLDTSKIYLFGNNAMRVDFSKELEAEVIRVFKA